MSALYVDLYVPEKYQNLIEILAASAAGKVANCAPSKLQHLITSVQNQLFDLKVRHSVGKNYSHISFFTSTSFDVHSFLEYLQSLNIEDLEASAYNSQVNMWSFYCGEKEYLNYNLRKWQYLPAPQ